MADSALQKFTAARMSLPLGGTLAEMMGAFGAQHVSRRFGGAAGLEAWGVPAEFLMALGLGAAGAVIGGDAGKAMGQAGRGAAVSWAAGIGAASGIAAHIAREE